MKGSAPPEEQQVLSGKSSGLYHKFDKLKPKMSITKFRLRIAKITAKRKWK
jgi:hypothetical protein